MTRQILDDTDIPSRRVQFGSHDPTDRKLRRRWLRRAASPGDRCPDGWPHIHLSATDVSWSISDWRCGCGRRRPGRGPTRRRAQHSEPEKPDGTGAGWRWHSRQPP